MSKNRNVRKADTIIEVCVGLHCSMDGSYRLLEDIKTHYNLQIGIVSNGMLIIERECMGMCKDGKVVSINGIAFTRVSFKSIIKYINALHIKQ